jgi:hypothetical protein
MGDFSDFELWQIVGARLAGTSVTKTATLLGVSGATASKGMSACETWEDNVSKEEQRAKINIDWKRSSYIEKDSFEKSELLQHMWQ